MMKTKLKYLDDTYADVDEGVVLRIGRDERGSFVVLDQTIFYPQGGGQPTDTGTIKTEQCAMNVSFVGFNEGEVFHYITEEPVDFDGLVGQSCALHVDTARRLEQAKAHTAGHLISSIIDAERGALRAVKGFHFSDGPYVEFEGKPEGETADILAALQTKLDECVAEGLAVNAEMVTIDELRQRCWSVPSYLPEDKPLRVVTIEKFDAVPCGGTHIANLAELGVVSVLKMKSKKGNTKISYRVGSAG